MSMNESRITYPIIKQWVMEAVIPPINQRLLMQNLGLALPAKPVRTAGKATQKTVP